MDDTNDSDNIRDLLKDVYTCPICGMRKTHHRLYGYRCNNPEHAEMEAELLLKQRMDKDGRRWQPGKRHG